MMLTSSFGALIIRVGKLGREGEKKLP